MGLLYRGLIFLCRTTKRKKYHKKILKTIDFPKSLWYNKHIKNKHGKERLTKPLLVFVINAYFGGT